MIIGVLLFSMAIIVGQFLYILKLLRLLEKRESQILKAKRDEFIYGKGITRIDPREFYAD